VKLWILSASIVFFLFLVFFSRQFPKYNPWFSAYLVFTVTLQLVFAIALGAGIMRRIPLGIFDIAGWLLIGAAMVTAWRAQDAVNGIIQDGLALVIVLNLLAVSLIIWKANPPAALLRTLASNLACVVPTGYMLVRFSFIDSDWLAVWARQIQNSRFNIQEATAAAANLARPWLG
jgi:hypothetical protein